VNFQGSIRLKKVVRAGGRSMPTRHMHGGGGGPSPRIVTGAAVRRTDGDVIASAFARKLGSGCRARRLCFWLGLHAVGVGEEDPFSRIRIRSNQSALFGFPQYVHNCSLSHLKRTVMLCFCRGTNKGAVGNSAPPYGLEHQDKDKCLLPLAAVNWAVKEVMHHDYQPRFGIPSSPIICTGGRFMSFFCHRQMRCRRHVHLQMQKASTKLSSLSLRWGDLGRTLRRALTRPGLHQTSGKMGTVASK
jgi:hypothetical protein